MDEKTPIKILCHFSIESLVKDCLSISLREFNKELNVIQNGLKLNENLLFWEFRFSKKNGIPKSDYPGSFYFNFMLNIFFLALDENNIITAVGANSFTLCCKDQKNGILHTETPETAQDSSLESISKPYENSLTNKRNELIEKKKSIRKTEKKKTKFSFFALFCV